LKAQYPKLKDLAMNDISSSVRTKALKAIADLFPNENNSDIYAHAAKDKSYNVEANLLKIYASTNKDEAWRIAKKESSSLNSNMQNAIAEFYAKEGTASEHQFFIDAFTRSSGFSLFLLIPHYKTYIKRMDDSVIKEGIQPAKDIATRANNTFVSNAVKIILKEMKTSAKTEELKAEIQEAIDSIK
jgi:hypothetical protein